MASTSDLDELLRPILSAADDASGFDRPWRPWSLVVLGVLGGPLAAGPLAAWNFRLLGQQSCFAPSLAAVLVVWLGLVFAAFELYGHEGLERRAEQRSAESALEPGAEPLAAASSGALDFEERRRSWVLLLRILGVVPLLAIAALQRKRFRLFEGVDGNPRSLWLPGILALVAANVVSMVLIPVIYMAFLAR